ncbi:hypothetical protein [Aminobacterium colombiense]
MADYKKVFLGSVAVDSGQLILVDPCYLLNVRDEPLFTRSAYQKISELTLHGENSSGSFTQGGFGVGVAFASGHGDGYYPVYALVKSGRPMCVWVEMEELSLEEMIQIMEE